VVVWLYPRRFRAEYAADLRQVLRDLAREPDMPTWRLWLTVLADVPRSVVPEHVASWRGGEMELKRIVEEPAVRVGAAFGLGLGLALAAFSVVNQAFVLDARGSAILNNGFTAAHVLCGVAAFAAARSAGTVRAGLVAGVTASLVGSVIGIAVMWIATPIFYENNFHNPGMLDDFRRSGMRSMDAFIVDDALGASFFGTTLSMLLGMALGAVGGVLGKAAAHHG
jgi:hypothetical protein